MIDAETLRLIVELFAIPMGMLVVEWLINGRFSSPTELFVFLGSLDFVYLLKRDLSIPRINQHFASVYSSTFAISLLISLIFLIVAAKTEGLVHEYLIHKHRRNNQNRHYYPLFKVCLCWVVAMTSITFHLVVLFGGK